MSVRCIVVDDEPLAIDLLTSYIAKVSDLQLIAACDDALQAFDILQKEHIDLVFLDIQMPKLTGIELLKSLSQPPKVVFTTAYRTYAVESYELEVLDYLLKPITFDRFLKAVQKYYRHNNDSKITTKKKQTIVVRHNKRMVQIAFNDILYIESMRDYVHIHTRKETLIVKDTLRCFEDELPPDQFVKIHRSFIVAKEKITSFTSLKVEVDNHSLPVSRRYREQFFEAIGARN